jgi:hypothetical protein
MDTPEYAARTANALGGLTTAPTAFDRDPMLRHLAAMSLYQEVNLLSRYVTDAVRYRGGQAFLVRLQLSVLPSQRKLPYDVTTDITIHPQDMMAHAGLAQANQDAERTAKLRAEAKEKDDPETAEKVRLERKEGALARAWKALYPGHDYAPGALTGPGGDTRWAPAVARVGALYPEREGKEAGHRPCPARWDSVNVVPMVVTDNLEGIAASRSTDSATQLGLALMATVANMGAGANFSETKEAIRRAQGRDTNSLLTVARLTEDTVRIRLGAAQSPSLGNTLLPRTHNISLVVIFRPCEADAIDPRGEERMLTAVTKASFTDVFTGKTLPYQPAVERMVDLTTSMNRKYNNRFSYLEYAHLYRLVSRQDREGFFDFFDKKLALAKADNLGRKGRDPCDGLSRDLSLRRGLDLRLRYGSAVNDIKPKDKDNELLQYLYGEPERADTHGCFREVLAHDVASNALWTDLQSVRPFGEYSYANIPVVLQKIAPALPDENQTAVLSYNDAGATVTLYQGKHLGPIQDAKATLKLMAVATPKKDAPAGTLEDSAELVIPASSEKPSDDGRSLGLTFPAFHKIPVGNSNHTVSYTKPKINVQVGRMHDGRTLPDAGVEDYKNVRLVEAKAAPEKTPDYSLAAPATAVVADASGKARFSLFVKKENATSKAAKLRLTVEGAEVAEVTGAQPSEDGGWSVAGPGRIAFTFEGLMPGQSVKLALLGTTDGKEAAVATALSRPIFALPAPPKD